MKPPFATQEPCSFEIHGQKINDDYAWLRDKNWPASVNNPKILDYLEQENRYFAEFFKPLATSHQEIFAELKGRIKLADQSVYVKKDHYYYYSKTLADQQYQIYCRKLGVDAEEQILLDVNQLAEGKNFTQLGGFAISPKHNLMAYSVDFTGEEKYTAKVYDLDKHQYLTDEIPDTAGRILWHEELSGFFYSLTNDSRRPDKIMFHYLGSLPSDDQLVFHEPSPLYSVAISESSSRQQLFVTAGGLNDSVSYVIDMKDHHFRPKLLRARQEGIFYDVDHNDEYFYFRTNYQAKNFRIIRIKASDLATDAWQESYISYETDQYLESYDLTKNYLILNYSVAGLPMIKIRNLADGETKTVNFPDVAFEAGAGSTNFEEDDIRISYSSLARPNTTYSYDFNLSRLSILKVQQIPSGFNPDEYTIKRLTTKGKTKIPITVLYKTSLFKSDGSNPLYLYGYGAYGISASVGFNITAISLVDRGFVYAISHVRGGDDLGHDWYEAAKFLNKKRTFKDFIASAEQLIADRYTSSGNIIIRGGSAGGMLMGAVMNQRPELFKAVIAHVPFVDVLNTMLDEALPLTPGEFKEWGNPKDPDYFDYIKSYSPYDNVKRQAYPHLMITAGLSDPRVGYWEAAKWLAKLRQYKTDDNWSILKTNMDAGHGGASGRFDYLKEAANDLVFMLAVFGKTPVAIGKQP